MMSIHGWASKGKWQNELTISLNRNHILSAPYNYGFRFFRASPWHIGRLVRKFRDWYFLTVDSQELGLQITDPLNRPSIMVHSLGTWIVARAIQKYPKIKFDKIFLFGSIIPSDFDWYNLIINDQVNSIIYEKANSDGVVPWSFIFTGSFNPSSKKGFSQESPFVEPVMVTKFGHSDFQYSERFKTYIQQRLYKEPHLLSIKRGRDLNHEQIKEYFKETLRIDLFENPQFI